MDGRWDGRIDSGMNGRMDSGMDGGMDDGIDGGTVGRLVEKNWNGTVSG
jgi:hypothetical protein